MLGAHMRLVVRFNSLLPRQFSGAYAKAIFRYLSRLVIFIDAAGPG
jgi:hypothetical protein